MKKLEEDGRRAEEEEESLMVNPLISYPGDVEDCMISLCIEHDYSHSNVHKVNRLRITDNDITSNTVNRLCKECG